MDNRGKSGLQRTEQISFTAKESYFLPLACFAGSETCFLSFLFRSFSRCSFLCCSKPSAFFAFLDKTNHPYQEIGARGTQKPSPSVKASPADCLRIELGWQAFMTAYSGQHMKVLFASRVVPVALRFWPVFSFCGSLFMMLFTFFYSHKHPVVFFVHASAKQSLNRQDCHLSRKLTSITIALSLKNKLLECSVDFFFGRVHT